MSLGYAFLIFFAPCFFYKYITFLFPWLVFFLNIGNLYVELALKETNQVITTIVGIGEILGAIIVSEIGDISRFDSASKLVAFAGLDATVSQSGQFVGNQNKISKRGSPYLRRAIWTAATVAAFADPALSEYYQSLKSRGKHLLTAIGAVARKLCNIIFAVLRDNKPYVPMMKTS
jgi:transposase